MSTIKLQSGTIAKFALLGKAITPDLFGVNFIFTNDRWDSNNTLVSAGSATPAYTYDDILNALGAGNAPLHTIRYPGGAVTESYLDLNVASFFSSTHNGKSITSPGSFLDLCRQQNVDVAFVMPTKRFIGTQVDSTGNRVEGNRTRP